MVEKNTEEKRTQAQRRAETRAALLDSACRLFGERGYDATSLEDIAEDCGLTIRPVYYHFGSKRELFLAVNELMEERAFQALNCPSSTDAWYAFLTLCEDPGFRQIILEDAPNVAGRERWIGLEHLPWSGALSPMHNTPDDDQNEMRGRLALATLIEAAMAVLEDADSSKARGEATELIANLLPDRQSGADRPEGEDTPDGLATTA